MYVMLLCDCITLSKSPREFIASYDADVRSLLSLKKRGAGLEMFHD